MWPVKSAATARPLLRRWLPEPPSPGDPQAWGVHHHPAPAPGLLLMENGRAPGHQASLKWVRLGFSTWYEIGIPGLEAPFGNGLEAHWTHWLEASVTANLTKQSYVIGGSSFIFAARASKSRRSRWFFIPANRSILTLWQSKPRWPARGLECRAG